jgi:hypothetical protein
MAGLEHLCAGRHNTVGVGDLYAAAVEWSCALSEPTEEDKKGGWMLIGMVIGVIGLSLLLVLAHVAGWL